MVILNLASKAQKKTRQGQTLPQFQRKLRHIESAHRSASTFSGGLPAAQGQAHSHSGRPGPPQLHADTQGTPSWGWPHDRTLLRQGLSLWGIPHYPVSSGGKKNFPLSGYSSSPRQAHSPPVSCSTYEPSKKVRGGGTCNSSPISPTPRKGRVMSVFKAVRGIGQ